MPIGAPVTTRIQMASMIRSRLRINRTKPRCRQADRSPSRSRRRKNTNGRRSLIVAQEELLEARWLTDQAAHSEKCQLAENRVQLGNVDLQVEPVAVDAQMVFMT
jgi:hypothetical protein